MTAGWYSTPVDSIASELDSGFFEVYTGSQPTAGAALTGTKLASLPFSATAFGSSTGTPPVATANAITTENALATGTAGYGALLKSDGTTVACTFSLGTSGADFNFTNLSFTSGTPVAVTSFTITG